MTFRKGKLAGERIDALNGVGFVWDPLKNRRRP
jgi:hypothetical protein